MKNIEGGTFLQEAQKRVPEKIIINNLAGERFVETNKKSGSFLLNLARDLNPNFQIGVNEVSPLLFYGTVDPVGNVSELLTMMNMAQKLNVPMVLTLDDVAYDLQSCAVRIIKPSLEVAGLTGSRLDEKLRFDKVQACLVLPNEIMEVLEDSGLDKDVNLAEAYEAGLYLLAEEFFGLSASENLVIMRASEIFSLGSGLGQMPLGFLRKEVEIVASGTSKESLVFVHFAGEKIRSNDSQLDGLTLSDLYKSGGSLGGTAWVSLTTMFLDKNIFSSETHPLILAEKDTTLGGNFATVYEKLLTQQHDANRIAVTGIRRIKANKKQGGGDGIDPLVLLYLLKNSSDSVIYKTTIQGLVQDGFPMSQLTQREKEVVLGEQSVINTAKVTMLKEKLGIGGNELIKLGVDKRLLGKALLLLAEEMLSGRLRSDEDIINLLQSI